MSMYHFNIFNGSKDKDHNTYMDMLLKNVKKLLVYPQTLTYIFRNTL